MRYVLAPSGGMAPLAAAVESLLTRSFSSLLGLKYGMRLAGTSTRAPVFGLRPTRGCRWRVRKLPTPRFSILSPPRKARTTLSKIASTITSESLRVISTTRETSSINSALVMLSAFPFSSSIHDFLDGQGRRRSLALILVQARAFFVLGHGAETQPDFLLRFPHLDDLEIVLIADRQRRITRAASFKRSEERR